MPHILFLSLLLACATLFALLEVEIEGSNGWASELPTWRLDTRWTRLLLGSRSLTGYHLYVHLFILALIHFPYALAVVPPSLKMEARIASFLILFWILEDFLWFVVNPAYGIRRFRKEEVWWHREAWWWVMPREYWIFVPLATALYLWSWS